MTLSELVAQVYLKATGKRSSLGATDEKYLKIREIANIYIDAWQNEPGIEWASLYDKAVSIGTVTATDTFELDESIRKVSDERGDYVKIQDPNSSNNYTKYDIVPADRIKQYDDSALVCAISGHSVIFPSAFTADSSVFGWTIYVPAYLYAETLTNAGDEVPVDIPLWLVFMSAAEYVRNDVTKQNQYPNLVQEANQLMERMKSNNGAQIDEANVRFTSRGRTW